MVQIGSANEVFWSKTGHRIIGEVAQDYLSGKSKRAISKLLQGQDLAFVSNFADEIKADKNYRKFGPWHYVNVPEGKKYKEVTPNKKGDLIQGINHCIKVLKDENASVKDKQFYLKMLVHLVGDLHQPMHAGRAADKGGNDIQLQWHGRGSNLHKVWDTNMITGLGFSYSEWANSYAPLSKKERKKMQEGSVYTWLEESQALATSIYNSVENGDKIGYKYSYDHLDTVRSQLQKGGLRLAKILNDVFSTN